jgi:hypothetical protein
MKRVLRSLLTLLTVLLTVAVPALPVVPDGRGVPVALADSGAGLPVVAADASAADAVPALLPAAAGAAAPAAPPAVPDRLPEDVSAPELPGAAGAVAGLRVVASASTPDVLAAGPPPLPGSPGMPSLGGRFLIANNHGALFYRYDSDLWENAAYASWLGAGAIRVFGTDSNLLQSWDGKKVGQRIVQWAPALRTHRLKLIVAFVNNHQPVPGEPKQSAGMLNGYFQLLLPFYRDTWRGPYLRFVRDLVTTVREGGALDVIGAWELGNELHTQEDPNLFPSFLMQAVAEVKRLDAITPIWPGTMGVHHLQPWTPRSGIARWLYCEAPVDAYTLHAYDWVSPDRPGDMPINWDLDGVVSEPCPSGRRLPVVVEELGTSRALPGYYTAAQEDVRLEFERRELRMVLGYPQVQAVGVWNGVSPRATETFFLDNKRGLTSYGPDAMGTGSCYVPPGQAADPRAATQPRCRLEQMLRALPAAP